MGGNSKMSILDEAKENLGITIDRVDSLAHALKLKVPDNIHVESLRSILPEVAADLKKYFVQVTGENPWTL
jgi:hypothetical protein